MEDRKAQAQEKHDAERMGDIGCRGVHDSARQGLFRSWDNMRGLPRAAILYGG